MAKNKKKVKILLIEDALIQRNALISDIHEFLDINFQVEIKEAVNSEQAYREFLDNQDCRLIVVDISINKYELFTHFNKFEGVSLIGRIYELNKIVKIIAYTSLNRAEVEKLIVPFKAIYIQKEINTTDNSNLLRCIKNILNA